MGLPVLGRTEYLKQGGQTHRHRLSADHCRLGAKSLVEIHNQIAKEIGYKTWMGWGTTDFEGFYPGTGHPLQGLLGYLG